MTTAEAAANVKEFGRAFWRAMGDRENHMVAYRQFFWMAGIFVFLLVVVTAAQHVQP